MAFGFFKKREYATIVFKNASFYTMDPDQPEAEAVACKDGQILAIGDEEDMESFIGPQTEIIDLEGQTVVPGFIKLRSALAQEAFADRFRLFTEWTGTGLTGLKEAVSKVLKKVRSQDPLFVYGGYVSQVHGLEMQEIRETLDQLCPQRPLLILTTDCTMCLMNSAAIETIRAAAEEDGIRNISLDYIVSVIAPPDYEAYQSYLERQGRSLAKEGFTAVHDGGSFDYPQAIYRSALQELLMEDRMNQRYLSSYLMMVAEDPALVLRKIRQRQTECIELQGMIRCDGFHLCILPGAYPPEEYLEKLCVNLADIGCDFTFTAREQEGLEQAARCLSAIRDSGYKKNAAVLSYDDVLSVKEIYESISEDDVVLWSNLDPSSASTVEQALERLTVDAAAALGMDDQIGSLRKGMAADFTVLPKNPYEGSLNAFHNMKVSFTVVGGRIVK